MVQKTPKQQNTQRNFRRNSLKKNIRLTAFHLWLRKLFEDFCRFVSRKKKHPSYRHWTEQLEFWKSTWGTSYKATYACCIAHKRPERGRLGVFSVSVVKFYGFIKYCIYVLCVHAVSNLLTLWCLSMEQIHILLWIAKPRKMSSESLELVTQVCFSLFYVYWTRWY